MLILLYFSCSQVHRPLHSFPTRRSSDLDTELSTAVDVVAIALGVAPSANQHEKIRLRLVTEQIVARVFSLFSVPADEQVPTLRQSSDQRDGPETTIVLSRQQHPRVAWMDRKSEHLSSEYSDGTRRAVNRSQVGEQHLGALQGSRIRGFQPAEGFDIVHATGLECQDRLREIQTFHFREFLDGTRAMLMRSPQTQAVSRGSAASAACSLVSCGAADFLDEQGVDATMRVIARNTR